MSVEFGINFMPTAPVRKVTEWARAVERHGFAILGISDSQSICRDVYVTLALCAAATERIRLGPRVITPVTRHPAVAASAAATLEELAPGRTLVAIGEVDAARYNYQGLLSRLTGPQFVSERRQIQAALQELDR